ncbi:YfhO family protein [Patescibacteria group bacterium]|nr:YfhO family protein [Patescibacteria group bacterium]
MNFFKKNISLLFLLLLSIFSILPLFHLGFFPMHDDTQVGRVFEMGKALKDGVFPVRWVQDLGYGYGYPIFNFYAPLAYYIGGFFNVLGFDALVSTKMMMGFGIILAGIFMYFLAKEIFGNIAGIVAALFYVYTPYHAVDIYVRGDVAEFWAYAFIPFVFYGLLKIYKQPRWQFVILGSLGYAGIILSHNLTAMMATPFLLITTLLYCLIAYKEKRKSVIRYLLSAIFLGLIISAFYWIPALLEMKYTNVFSQIGGGADFRDHFVCINQLWQSPWGYGGSVPGCIDGLSFVAGKLHILVSIASLAGVIFLFIFKKQKQNAEKILIIGFSFLGFIFSVFLTLEISKFIWQAIPLMAFFQYPWRFLLMVSFFSSLLAGSFIWLASSLPLKRLFPHYVLEISAILIFALCFLNIKFFAPQKILQVNSNYYTNQHSLKWTTSKISDEYLPKGIKKPKNANEALLNKQIFMFKETPIEKTANIISICGIVVLFIGIILPGRKYYGK